MTPQATVRADRSAVKSFPFAALPHALRRDPRLNTRAIVTAAALLEYARDRPSCWPSNGRLARDMGCSVGTARNGLASLLRAGWIAVKYGTSNPTGRVIVLAWRRPTAATGVPADCAPPCQPIGGGGCATIGTEASLKNEGEKERPSADEGPETPRPPAEDEGEDEALAALLARGDVMARLAMANRARPDGDRARAISGDECVIPTPPLPSPAEVARDSVKIEESPEVPKPFKTRGPEESAKVEESRGESTDTQVRVPQAPRPAVRAPAQVPDHARPTMRKSPSQRLGCVGIAHLLRDVITWPRNPAPAVGPPPRPPAST